MDGFIAFIEAFFIVLTATMLLAWLLDLIFGRKDGR